MMFGPPQGMMDSEEVKKRQEEEAAKMSFQFNAGLVQFALSIAVIKSVPYVMGFFSSS